MNRKSIIMIGPFPPTIGGVSIHTSRLSECLEEKYKVYKIDTTRNRLKQLLKLFELIIRLKFELEQFIVHNQVFKIEFSSTMVMLCKLFRVPYIQTVHSFRLKKDDLSNRKILFIKFIINNSYVIIGVSNKIKNDLIEFEQNANNKVCVIPAFIPYVKQISSSDNYEYISQLGIESFVKSHEILLCANAYKIAFYNNEDLYGIDLCIELIRKLRNTTNYNVGLVFMLPQIGDEKYYNTLISRIEDYNLENDFIFITKEVELVPLFEFVHIFLRPTNTDGDALSIREALFSGVPSIASDIVERPLGTITFKNRDSSDLFKKVIYTIENIEEEKIKAQEYGSLQENLLKKYDLLQHLQGDARLP